MSEPQVQQIQKEVQIEETEIFFQRMTQSQETFMLQMYRMQQQAVGELMERNESFKREIMENQQQQQRYQQEQMMQQQIQQQTLQQQMLIQAGMNQRATGSPNSSTTQRTEPERESVNELRTEDLGLDLPDPSSRRNIRRDSAAGRLTTFNGVPERENILTIKSDRHADIIWENRSVDGFLKFVEDIDRFTLTYNQPVPYLFTHVSENLQEVLAELMYVHKPHKYRSKTDVFKATTADIYEMAQIYFAPRDLAHFVSLLTTSCKKYEVVQKGDFYAPTRLRLYGLRQKFRERFEFLSEGAVIMGRREAIPAVNYKYGGLLNVWTDLTPEGSRESFKQMLINGKYDNLDQFLEKYFLKVDETNNLSENLKVYKYRINSGRIQAATNVREQIHGKLNQKQNLFSMEDYDEEQLDKLDEIQAEEDLVYALEDKDMSKEPCPKLLVTGKCWNRECKFSHSMGSITQKKAQLMKTWTTEKEQPNDSQRKKTYKIPGTEESSWSRNGRPNVTDNSQLQKRYAEKKIPAIRSMEEEEEEDSPEETEFEGETHVDPDFAMISAFLKLESGTHYHNVARRSGMATLKDATTFEIKAALFDSGATASNYISKKCVKDNKLESSLVTVDKSVKVANGTVCKINEKMSFNIEFLDQNGRPIAADLEFYVLEGLNMEVVIGLPAICEHFKDLFIEMIEGTTLSNIHPAVLERETIDLNWEAPICEEEIMIPHPASFQNILFLEQTYEASLQEYLEQLPTRIAPEFQASTPVFEYLGRDAVDVFVPSSWTGIRGVEPIQLEFDASMPARMRPAMRRIPAAVLEPAKKEFDRMCGYMYQPSTSPISSPIVVAPKSTPPYVRLCGDYRAVNEYIKMFNFPIPDPRRELHRAAAFKVFIDLDMKNAFHGLRLHWYTSRMLSIQTPYGQFEPLFLPEGVSPASLLLMATMSDIFMDYYQWMIVIFDNMLILALDYQDAYAKLVKVITRCKERNVVLKLSKSKFGFSTVEFFGFVCTGGSYALSEQRVKEVSAIPFPSTVKKMQQFLGAAMFFKPFIYNFAKKTAKLHDMVTKTFNWNRTTWQFNYEEIFNNFKGDIKHSFTLNHPDFTLPWFLYVDASDLAVGGVLVQIAEGSIQQVVAFVSKKLSATAQRWSTIEKEAFAMFYAVSSLQYYLFLKKFTLLTDHNNLLWMESSLVPKIIRIRLFLQSYQFNLIHVKGKENVFADWLSRMYPDRPDELEHGNVILTLQEQQPMDEVSQMITKVHNGRMGHHGVQRTWLLLNRYFPGHNISVRLIQDFVSTCAWCQKVRATLNQSLQAPIRAIVAEHPRHLCGYDTLYVTPMDEDGFQYLHVFKMIPSRLVALYPAKDLSAEGLASAMYLFFATYGITEVLITDPGANINSDVVKKLLEWSGVRLRMSITGRHESNMVERSHRETLRFLSTLVNEERLKKVWSKPHIITTIQFILNSEVSKETSVSPYEYVFGSDDAKYFKLPATMDNCDAANQYICKLNDNLKHIRQIAKNVQEKYQKQRQESNPDAGKNSYQLGDKILIDESKLHNKKDKLSSRFSGPYELQRIHKSDLTAKHIVTGKVRTVHMQHVQLYFGSSADAYQAAMSDDDQYIIRAISNYKGDPESRSKMHFLVLFEDNDEIWLPYNLDLISSAPFQRFCESKPELQPLLHTVKAWNDMKKLINDAGITGVQPGQTCFVDLRAWGWDFVENSGLPDVLQRTYVVACKYLKWSTQRKLKLEVQCSVFQQLFKWSAVDVNAYGKTFDMTEDMILVDQRLCQRFPKLLD